MLEDVGSFEASHACRVDVEVDRGHVLNPVFTERTVEDFDALSLSSHFDSQIKIIKAANS